MADALGRAPSAPMSAQPPPIPPVPERDPHDELRRITEAELYATIYPRRAALIRSLGSLPSKPDFRSPRAELVHAIVSGTSPTLKALDTAAVA